MSDKHAPHGLERCDVEELRTLFLFDSLAPDQLDWLCEHGGVEHFDPGYVFREGEDATCFYVLLDGTIALHRAVGGDDVEVNRTSARGVYFGATMAYLDEGKGARYSSSCRAVTPLRAFRLSGDDFGYAVRTWFPMAIHLLAGLRSGTARTASVVNQRERLLALGSLSAGLTHELNNPAAAAVRATSSLRDRVAGMRHKLTMIAEGDWDRDTLTTLMRLQEHAVERIGKAPELDPLTASDREDEFADWFDDHGIAGGYDIAPTFVQAGLDIDWLERVAHKVSSSTLEATVRWLTYTLETELLMSEIEDSTTRISTLVTAAKQYSQMDRAPYQVVDLHELIDSTLVMLSRKIAPGVEVVKDYDRSLPDVPVYAAELNQVWTNVIDNALQAMGDHGTLTIRTSRDDDNAVVEIGDTGPGIPDDAVDRIFEPFFTTKAVGEGTGLGLDISWRIVVKKHHGDISVRSRPGETVFRICVPLAGAQADDPAVAGSEPTDEMTGATA